MSHSAEKSPRRERESGFWDLGFGVWGKVKPVPRPCDPSAASRAGFTLLEVLVALAILAMGILGAMQLFPASLRQTRAAAERTAAANLANSEMTRLRSLDIQREFLSWLDKNTLETLAVTEQAYALY
ncbi:MAG TPA: prepilin-type N-terminal cleavage/methylation domain-containing protein, partial [Candidatus Hydrogenedentes bacterium]|nr:prepilin-type N-terminal cleavage/methylation domain-containing protein [Candidatus Hydrogenedentota bacterium]